MPILKHPPVKELSPADLSKKYADRVRKGKTAKDHKRKAKSGTT